MPNLVIVRQRRQEKPKNLGQLELRCLGTGGVADAKIHAPPPHVLPRQIW